MAYSYAPRFSDKCLSGTPKNLAPNNYIICDRDYNLKNRVPFLSSATRKFSLGQKLYTHNIYNPLDSLPRNIIGGASLRNKDKRLRDLKSDTPGPAEYDPKIPKKGCKYVAPPCHGTGNLYVCRVPYTVTVSAPSIPTQVDENGYDLTIDNDIVKVPPDDHDRTRGPAYYHIPRGEIFFTTRRYHKCCAWSKSKTKRDRSKIENYPGPGTYDLDKKLFQPNEEDEEYRQLARLFSFAPRYTEMKMLQAAAEDQPGPGHYGIPSKVSCCKSYSINPRPMVAGAVRFTDLKSGTPAPGTYEICDCPTEQKQFSIKDIPFGNQANRFKVKKDNGFPGPSTYEIKGAIQTKIDGKFNKYTSVDVPFFKTAERKMSFSPPDAEFFPSPDEYDVENTDVEKEDIHASVFKSGTRRFRYGTGSGKVGPASYNITEAFKKNHSRTSHHSGKVAFLSSAKRGEKFMNIKNPGPGEYLGLGELECKGLRFGTANRFKYSLNDYPPPGHYSIHPSVENSMYKATGTHNLRLKENVKRTKLKLPPSATFESWMAEMKKNKKLRWFSKPTLEYVHCLTTE